MSPHSRAFSSSSLFSALSTKKEWSGFCSGYEIVHPAVDAVHIIPEKKHNVVSNPRDGG